MRSPIGDGARCLAFVGGAVKVAERRTLDRTPVLFRFAAKPEAVGGVTAEGGGVAGRGGETGLLEGPWKKAYVKMCWSVNSFLLLGSKERTELRPPPRERRRRTPAPRAC